MVSKLQHVMSLPACLTLMMMMMLTIDIFVVRCGADCTVGTRECNGCYNMTLCLPKMGGGGQEVTVQCSDSSSTKIYCDKTTMQCTSDKSKCDPPPMTSSDCYGEGYLPDPYDCKRYMLCMRKDGGTLVFKSYTCPDYSQTIAYDHLKTRCRENTTCWTFSDERLCRNKAGRFVTYPPDESIWAMCPRSAGDPLYIGKCNSPYEFDLETWSCKPVCRTEGRMADLENDEKFYECYKQGSEFVLVHEDCPTDTKYDATSQTCEFPKTRSSFASRSAVASRSVRMDPVAFYPTGASRIERSVRSSLDSLRDRAKRYTTDDRGE